MDSLTTAAGEDEEGWKVEPSVIYADNLEAVSCPIDVDDRDDAGSLAETSGRGLETEGIPVFVMLPLDTVTSDGFLNQKHLKALDVGLRALKAAQVDGVMVDVWWGVVEREGPGQYDWAAYKRLLQMVKRAGLHMSAVMSFHACGGNVGDCVYIPLPGWVEDAMLEDPELMYTDKHGFRNSECISLFADHANTLMGRTPLECYTDFMASFRDAMGDEIGTTVTDISVGCGPCGELRYPAYPEGAGRWHFPGLGEFQCYDKRALGRLAAAASDAGRIEWGGSGPHDSGGYNDRPHQTGFFNNANGSWMSDYGHFFLSWYSEELLAHGDRMLAAASLVFEGQVTLNLKCAGVHWWFNSRSHSAELTAGYYNTRYRDGYDDIAQLCARYDAHLNFTCVEMRDMEHPDEACCSPEGLLRQVRGAAARWGVPVAGENALTRFDGSAYDRVVDNAVGVLGEGVDDELDPSLEGTVPPMAAFTFLRLTPMLFEEHNMGEFVSFVSRIKGATAESAVAMMAHTSELLGLQAGAGDEGEGGEDAETATTAADEARQEDGDAVSRQ